MTEGASCRRPVLSAYVGGAGAGILTILLMLASGTFNQSVVPLLEGVSSDVATTTLMIGLALPFVAPLPVMLVGLYYGLNSLLAACLGGMVLGAVLADIENLVMFAIGFCLPSICFAWITDDTLWPERFRDLAAKQREERVGWAIILICSLYTAGLVGAELFQLFSGHGSLKQLLTTGLNLDDLTPKGVQMAQLTMGMLHFMPAILTMIVVFIMLFYAKISALLIRGIWHRDWFRFSVTRLRLPLWFLMPAAVICAAGGLAGGLAGGVYGFALGNAAVILAVPAMLNGLAVINQLLHSAPYRWLVGLLVYSGIAFTAVFGSVYVLVLLGFLDTPLGIRDWLAARQGRKMEGKHA